ncbi:hypothetical protein [Butyrivibrio sp. INlla16]|uniref:hypothetical protein n=1 Tax=Butyrivibrio sp. INlla16 TaxID=1520807 RepID=UPI0008908122|nr:hypothetical protein [Butyrivibrio sp. INlla16]SDB12768.1 hypothetical protein SAMN02910263_00576 [Butyrivibrio sp. INlla16]SDB49703.1 hypothetical protein SAMN02910263_02461 [Butyrivibrio sp. INlla16]
MGRPRKTETAELIRIVEEYFENEVNGNPRKLMYNKIADYASGKGIDAEGYHFRRDPDVKRRIEELKESLSNSLEDKGIVYYKSLDVDGIIRQCTTLGELKQHLRDIDAYWKKSYLELADMSKSYSRMVKERQSERDEVARCRDELKEARDQLADIKKELGREKQQNVWLRRFIRENVYPEVVNKLLRDHNIKVDEKEDKIIRPEAFKKLLESARPQAFDGVQEEIKKPATRLTNIMKELEGQVDSIE